MITYFRFLALIIITVSLLSGCQITSINETPEVEKVANKNTSYGEYYLKLQTLNEIELIEEVEKLQLQISQIPTDSPQHDYNTQIRLLLLYSLPRSPIYNTFNAKALLNKMKREEKDTSTIKPIIKLSPSETGLIALLRDQLNQRLLMRNRLLEQQQNQKDEALKQHQELVDKTHLLEQIIEQLKSIEQTINKREP